MNQGFIKILAVISVCWIIGCNGEDAATLHSPVIKFDSIAFGTETSSTFQYVLVDIDFSDPDGNSNLGFSSEDTLAPYNYTSYCDSCYCANFELSKNKNYYNYWITLFVKDSLTGKYDSLSHCQSIIYTGRFPQLSISNKNIVIGSFPTTPFVIKTNSASSGDLKYYLRSPVWGSYLGGKTIKASVQILDRDLHQSNLIWTDSLTIPKL